MTAQNSLHAQIETVAAAVIEAAVAEASREVAEAIVNEEKSENDVGIEVEVEKGAALGIGSAIFKESDLDFSRR